MASMYRLSFWVALIAVATWGYLRVTRVAIPDTIDGTVHPDFEKVREAFHSLVRDGWIKGSQFAVYYKNELVVDLAGGYANEEAQRLMKHDNYITTFSSVKSIFSLLLGMVVERAGISFDEPVSKYWPEFGQNGKQNVTIANLLLHQGGVCGLDRRFRFTDAEANSEYYQSILAEQPPLTPLNERPYYHGWTYGLYIDQVARRIDSKKRGLRQILAEELAHRCGGLDIHFGLPPAEFHRLAHFYGFRLETLVDNEGFMRIFRILSAWVRSRIFPETLSNSSSTYKSNWTKSGAFIEDFRGFEQVADPEVVSKFALAAAGSSATARDLARVYHLMANGGFCLAPNGSSFQLVKVLESETVEKMSRIRYSGPSGAFFGNETRSLFGWMFTSPGNTTILGSPGFGGQQAFSDPELGLSYAYFTNFVKPVLLKDRALTQLLDITYQVVTELRRS